jgi:DNA (cytosine-5)-methyltransferase 1
MIGGEQLSVGRIGCADRAGGPADPSPQAGSAKGAHPLRVLSLFAGIGGFDLGLERTGGFKTVAFCEIDPFCRRVLAKHWPEVPCFEDVRELRGEHVGPVDVIVGGFPCQGISIAGRGRGLEDPRSALWADFARLIGELRPRYAIVENSPKLRARGLLTILSALDAIGYDADWHCIPAAHVGAPHRRDRIWIIAHRQGDALCADADGFGPHPTTLHLYRAAELRDEQERDFGPLAWWRSEPRLERVADGPQARMDKDRIRAIGGAVVPQIPELIGRAILEARAA